MENIQTRRTRQKAFIYEAIRNDKTHPTAETIYRRLKDKYPRLSLATVYRNLNRMADKGELGRIAISGEALHFDSNAEKHAHAICTCCGRIIDLESDEIQERLKGYFSHIESSGCEAEGFKLENVDLKFYGLCSDCADGKRSAGVCSEA